MVHVARLVTIAALQILQWKVTIIGVPIDIWMLFLGLQILVSRIPIIPSRDILFVGDGYTAYAFVEYSGWGRYVHAGHSERVGQRLKRHLVFGRDSIA